MSKELLDWLDLLPRRCSMIVVLLLILQLMLLRRLLVLTVVILKGHLKFKVQYSKVDIMLFLL